MNVSMQDAFNLAWKLALVTKGLAPTELLDSYKDERLSIAKQKHEGTRFIHSIIMAHGKDMDERIALTQAPGWNHRAVNQIAGISYTYRQPEIDVPLTAGDRAPNVLFNGNQSLYKHLDKSVPTLFVMLADADDYEHVSADIVAIQEAFPIKAQIVGANNRLADDDRSIRNTYHVLQSMLYLIRPDRYIEYAGDSVDEVVARLDKILVRQ